MLLWEKMELFYHIGKICATLEDHIILRLAESFFSASMENCLLVEQKHFFFTVWRLLHDPSLKIGEIGEMVGYADTAHFARVFKKIVGMSANEYRNSL